MNAVELFQRAIREFDRRIGAAEGRWGDPTPCAEWDVRALVNHVVYEARWVPPLLAGQTIAEVGERFEGDLLGQVPRTAWTEAADEAAAAVADAGALDRVVHLSFGDCPSGRYLADVTSDIVIHTWDLARAVGADDRLEADLVELAFATLEPQVEEWRAAGAFGTAVEPVPGTDRQGQLLALVGRRP